MKRCPKPSFSIVGSLELYISQRLLSLKLGFKTALHVKRLNPDVNFEFLMCTTRGELYTIQQFLAILA